MFERANPFDEQEELTEPERYYMRGLIKKGCEVRYDDTWIYNSLAGAVARLSRSTLQELDRRTKTGYPLR